MGSSGGEDLSEHTSRKKRRWKTPNKLFIVQVKQDIYFFLKSAEYQEFHSTPHYGLVSHKYPYNHHKILNCSQLSPVFERGLNFSAYTVHTHMSDK